MHATATCRQGEKVREAHLLRVTPCPRTCRQYAAHYFIRHVQVAATHQNASCGLLACCLVKPLARLAVAPILPGGFLALTGAVPARAHSVSKTHMGLSEACSRRRNDSTWPLGTLRTAADWFCPQKPRAAPRTCAQGSLCTYLQCGRPPVSLTSATSGRNINWKVACGLMSMETLIWVPTDAHR